jgi:hypothetical protein
MATWVCRRWEIPGYNTNDLLLLGAINNIEKRLCDFFSGGAFNIPTYVQATEPLLPIGTIAFWLDTSVNPNQMYWIKNHAGVQYKVEMNA